MNALLLLIVVGVLAIALLVDCGALFGWCWRRARSVQSAIEKPYDADDDMRRSLEACYRAVRERVAAGGEGWKPR